MLEEKELISAAKAQLQCPPPQPQRLPALAAQPQVQPAPTYLEPQGSRAQPTALLHQRTVYKEDLHLIAITEDSQPQGPPTHHLQLQCPPPQP